MKVFTYTAKASRDFFIYAETEDEANEIAERTGIFLDIESDPKDEGSVSPDTTYGTEWELYSSEELPY